jgi:hypothetical protein
VLSIVQSTCERRPPLLLVDCNPLANGKQQDRMDSRLVDPAMSAAMDPAMSPAIGAA